MVDFAKGYNTNRFKKLGITISFTYRVLSAIRNVVIFETVTLQELLESIVVDENNPVYDSRDNCNAIIEKETNTLIVGCKNTVIPKNVMTIGEYAFYNCSNLTIYCETKSRLNGWSTYWNYSNCPVVWGYVKE